MPSVTRAEFAAEVRRAERRIRDGIVRTPLCAAEALSRSTGARVAVKWECDQRTGSFKIRGALNALRSLAPARRLRGIVGASTGNHGLGLAEACRLTGARLTLFVPSTIVAGKRRKLEAAGARLIEGGRSCDEAELAARAFAASRSLAYVSPYNDWTVIFGQGTLGREILADCPGAQAVLVPVGGGGLAVGIAGAIKAEKPGIAIWGVEPENSAFLKASLRAGRLVEIRERPTLADAVAGGIEPGAITFALARRWLDGIITVKERTLARALETLAELRGRPVEGAGALALAGLTTEPGRFRGRTVVLVVSGGNSGSLR